MKHVFAQLVDFHRAMQQPIGDFAKPNATVQMDLRVRLIIEEYTELLQALAPGVVVPNLSQLVEDWLADVARTKQLAEDAEPGSLYAIGLKRAVTPDLPAALDSLGDLNYVTTGAAVTWGLLLPEAHEEIHRANMQKSTGEVRPDGKRLKPPGFQPPNIAAVIRGAQLGIGAMVQKRVALQHLRETASYRNGDGQRYEAEIDVLDMQLRRLGFGPDGRPRRADEPELAFDRIYKQVVESIRQRYERGELTDLNAEALVEHLERLFTVENLDRGDEEEQVLVTREMVRAALEELKQPLKEA